MRCGVVNAFVTTRDPWRIALAVRLVLTGRFDGDQAATISASRNADSVIACCRDATRSMRAMRITGKIRARIVIGLELLALIHEDRTDEHTSELQSRLH